MKKFSDYELKNALKAEFNYNGTFTVTCGDTTKTIDNVGHYGVGFVYGFLSWLHKNAKLFNLNYENVKEGDENKVFEVIREWVEETVTDGGILDQSTTLYIKVSDDIYVLCSNPYVKLLASLWYGAENGLKEQETYKRLVIESLKDSLLK